MDEEDEGSKFCEEDIDQILLRRTHTITIESEGKGSTFAKVRAAPSRRVCGGTGVLRVEELALSTVGSRSSSLYLVGVGGELPAPPGGPFLVFWALTALLLEPPHPS